VASKKDKLGQAARKRLDETMGPPPGGPERSNMEDFVRDMRESERAPRQEKNAQPPSESASSTPSEESASIPKSVSPAISRSESGQKEQPRMELKKSRRDSIYNISSDIRLEDYTEGGGSSGGGMGKTRIIAGALLFLLLGLGIYYLGGWFFAPKFLLAVASEEITADNIEEAASKDPSLASGHDVHIRFQWPEEKLKATYIKVKVDRVEGGQSQEQAVLGQKPPRTANYVYFKGPLDPGSYHVAVMDESGSVMKDKDFKVR